MAILDLEQDVMDKTILDRHGRSTGKVDDLILELPDGWDSQQRGRSVEPEVAAILTGPLALTGHWRGWAWASRLGYRLLGVRHPHPVALPWSRVARIDVVVHLDLERDELPGLDEPSATARRRFIDHIPGA